MKGFTIYIIPVLILILSSCYPEENLNVPVNDTQIEIVTELDQYIDDHFTTEYGMAIRYKFVDRYVSSLQRVTAPRLESVRPMLDFVEEFWINPYLEVENGEDFFKKHVPPEIIFLGGLIYLGDGLQVLGTADAGARITFTNVNAIDPTDEEWRDQQLNTVYHEFAHTVHQLYKLPTAFETISPEGYTGAGSWFVLTDEEALERGFVSPYATSNPNEDFAETVSFFLFYSDFYGHFVDQEDCETTICETRNQGRDMIRTKISSITSHYEKVTGVDLEELRAAIQSRL